MTELDDPFEAMKKVGSEGDLTNRFFGDLQVTKLHKEKQGMKFWLCDCMLCGHVEDFNELKLLSGNAVCSECGSKPKQVGRPPAPRASQKRQLDFAIEQVRVESKQCILRLKQQHEAGEPLEAILSHSNKDPSNHTLDSINKRLGMLEIASTRLEERLQQLLNYTIK